jgi:hypothetical protein
LFVTKAQNLILNIIFSDEIETADNDYNSNTLKIFLISELVGGEEGLTEEVIGWGGYLKIKEIINCLINNQQLLLQPDGIV